MQQNGQQYDNLKQKLELQKTAHDQLKTKVEAAKKAYEDAIIAADKLGDDTEKAKAILKAQQTFADAIVKYYNAAAPLQLTVNKVTLKQSVTIGGETKESNVSKTVKEWLSDADNKDVYLAALITYFGNDATKLWTVGKAEDKYDLYLSASQEDIKLFGLEFHNGNCCG